MIKKYVLMCDVNYLYDTMYYCDYRCKCLIGMYNKKEEILGDELLIYEFILSKIEDRPRDYISKPANILFRFKLKEFIPTKDLIEIYDPNAEETTTFDFGKDVNKWIFEYIDSEDLTRKETENEVVTFISKILRQFRFKQLGHVIKSGTMSTDVLKKVNTYLFSRSKQRKCY